jgi:nucleotide-binding universal stress UspA family protein
MAAAMTDTDLPPHARGDKGGRVIVGVDDTPGGVEALHCAVALARARRARLVAVRAWGLGLPRHGGWRHHHSGRGYLAVGYTGTVSREMARELTRRALRSPAAGIPDDLDVAIETPEGNPGPVLTKIAVPGDVLVVGTAGQRRLKRVVHGSVSAYCTVHSRCPVAVVATGRPRWYFPHQGGRPAVADDPASRPGPHPRASTSPATSGRNTTGVEHDTFCT